MSDAAYAGFTNTSTGAPRPPFSVFAALKSADEQLDSMITRTSNMLERLRGAQPELLQAAKGSSSTIEGTAGDVQDKLRALSNNIAAIDNLL